VRPPRADIAAPPLPPDVEWVGGAVPRLERLVASGPLLVHFFDLAQLNSARAMPYVEAWTERYVGHGLTTLGVHSPRFSFTRSPEMVTQALPRLGIEWPVAVDSEHAIWRAYGCRGWPSLFLWSRGGALRWYQLGEGEYEATELAIRGALNEAGAGDADWPPLLEPIRAGDAPGAEVFAPSAEVFPGGSAETPWRASDRQPSLELDYEAGGAFLAADGEGEIALSVDGALRDPVQVRHPGLHALTVHERHESHRLRLSPTAGLSLYSVQFSPAPPA
jgi:hypothetical protein